MRATMLVSHLCSGSDMLVEALDRNPRVQAIREEFQLDHPLTLAEMVRRPHKLGTAAATHLFHLLHNHQLWFKSAYDMCKFVYVVGDPRHTLNSLVASGYDESGAFRYYCYRLRRMAEMSRKTAGAVVLTWEDLATGRGLPLVEKYLGLKEPLVGEFVKKPVRDVVSTTRVDEAEECKQRYLAFMYGQNVVRW